MEIDQFDRMWLIDTGRTKSLVPPNSTTPSKTCSPKLVIMDLLTDKIIQTHYFPPTVASAKEAYLNDIVVACTTQKACHAYVTNSQQYILTVYSLEENTSWSVQHNSMLPDPTASTINILGKPNYNSLCIQRCILQSGY